MSRYTGRSGASRMVRNTSDADYFGCHGEQLVTIGADSAWVRNWDGTGRVTAI